MSYENTLAELAKQDERVVVMTAENRAVIRNLPPMMAGRFVDVGIAEMTQIGMAAGLALRGRLPITHALATFLTLRAFEFIRTDVGLPDLPVKIVGGVPGFLSTANGPTHQAIEDIALMRQIPNMQVFCPADEAELIEALPAVVMSEHPVYMRYYDGQAAVTHKTPFAFGKAERLTEGSDLALLTYGFLLDEVQKAQKALEAAGHSVRLINMRTLAPVDEAEILAAATETQRLVVVEDHFEIGGLSSIVRELLHRHGQVTPLTAIALKARWFQPARLPEVLDVEGFTGEKIARRVLKELKS